jgi:hypothetical protein
MKCRDSVLAVAVALVMQPAQASASAGQPDPSFAAAMTDAALTLGARGDSTALGTLGMLVDVAEPWRSEVIARLEAPGALTPLVVARDRADRRTRRAYDALLARIAERQALRNVSAARVGADTTEVMLAFNGPRPSYLRVDAAPAGELMLTAPGCALDAVVYREWPGRPAERVPGTMRLGERSTVLPVGGPVLVRLERRDCAPDVTITTTWLAPRRRASYPAATGELRPDVAESPGQISLVQLGRRPPAYRFAVQTDPGWTYTVDVAAVSGGVDPALYRYDPTDPARAIEADDDGGWARGARIDGILGTGGVQRFAILQASANEGEVALVVTRRPVPGVKPGQLERLPIRAGEWVWRQVSLPAGHWTVAARARGAAVDPVLVVNDAATGRALAENDDRADGDTDAEAAITLRAPASVVIGLRSLDSHGDCELDVRPAGTQI